MSDLRVLNRQKTRPIDLQLFKQIAHAALTEFLDREHYELGVHLVGAREMAEMNEKYLRHEGSTDVITFDYHENDQSLHGEIFICIDEALIQARQFGVSWQSEVARYLVHGLLHLEGFDDTEPALRKAMKRRENNLVKELSTRFDFHKLSRRKRATR
ncbi:MAG TPA: rRNA maturation RNase YbeY [Verrucomicrobiae bacterium]|jgi:probable rRNA maturation factor|nr:rRNA maturation RNase YbeY [Verrucomicrobiae bacterium]